MKKTDETDDIAPEYDFSEGRRGRYSGRFYVDPGTSVGTAVVLRKAFPEQRLQPGDVGRIVATLGEAGFEVEFEFPAGAASMRVSLRPRDVRLPTPTEILHVRQTG